MQMCFLPTKILESNSSSAVKIIGCEQKSSYAVLSVRNSGIKWTLWAVAFESSSLVPGRIVVLTKTGMSGSFLISSFISVKS